MNQRLDTDNFGSDDETHRHVEKIKNNYKFNLPILSFSTNNSRLKNVNIILHLFQYKTKMHDNGRNTAIFIFNRLREREHIAIFLPVKHLLYSLAYISALNIIF